MASSVMQRHGVYLRANNEKTHCGPVTRTYSSMKYVNIGSDNGLSPVPRQAIILNNAGLLSIETLGTHISEFVIEIFTFSLKKMHLKISPRKLRPFCLGLNVIITDFLYNQCSSSSWYVYFKLIEIQSRRYPVHKPPDFRKCLIALRWYIHDIIPNRVLHVLEPVCLLVCCLFFIN